MRASEFRTVAALCERWYLRYHSPAFIEPDPLQCVLSCADPGDREVTAFIAASLALGRVRGILTAVEEALERVQRLGGGSLRDSVAKASADDLHAVAEGFVYRFFDSSQFCGLLEGLKRVLGEYGSLEGCFAHGMRTHGSAGRRADGVDGEPILSGARRLVDEIRHAADGRLDRSILLARPQNGSACKRLFLFLRWMVRRDAIDPGGWTAIDPSDLLVPVDTHMLRIARMLGLTSRSGASLAVSAEITGWFRRMDPADPVRFDFSLTRAGIHPGVDRQLALPE